MVTFLPKNKNIFTFNNGEFEADYIKFGSGKSTLVILPGLALKEVTLQSEAIISAYSVFEKDYTVYLFEKRKNVPQGFTINGIAADTAAEMRALGLEKAFVFGVSQGGMTAQLLAVHYPDLVKGLVLASTFAKSNPVFINLMNEWQAFAKSGDKIALNRSFFKNVYSKAYYEKYKEIFVSLENEGTPAELERFLILSEACRQFDCAAQLKKITCPVLVLGGCDDVAVPPEMQKELAAALGAEYYFYENYAHAVYDEAPDFKERIIGFLNRIK